MSEWEWKSGGVRAREGGVGEGESERVGESGAECGRVESQKSGKDIA